MSYIWWIDMREALTFDDVQLEPNYSEIESRNECKLTSRLTRHFAIRNPIVAAPMDTVCSSKMMVRLAELGSVGCLHRFLSIEEQVKIVSEIKSVHKLFGTPIIASIGATGDYQERTNALLLAGVDILLIDVAHGDHLHVKRALKWINSGNAPMDVIAGNVATADGALRLQDWGADAVRVGVGGGSMCETRVRTGIGVPQLSAVMDVFAAGLEIPIISDGGIRYPGDVAKALAAGANTVMVGSMLAGTDEAPGELFITGQWPKEQRYKVFRGSASASQKGSEARYVEGTSKLVPCKGPVGSVINTILDGVRSAMSYLGVDEIQDMCQVANFVKITHAGLIEAHPHGLR